MSLQILLHSSKTMRVSADGFSPLDTPKLLQQASELVNFWNQASLEEIEQHMKVSTKKAQEVKKLFSNWSQDSQLQTPAADAFIGDIYSGLQAHSWTLEDRQYAHQYLLILSGLYGGLRACDGIMPYRLEMGYKLPSGISMYKYWGNTISQLINQEANYLINLSAVEYTKALLPHTDLPVVTPKFLTVSPKTNQPTFVTVHAKVARGAMANWLIKHRIAEISNLPEFSDLGYVYQPSLSTPQQPVFVCQEFGGLGLSVRLS